MLLAVISIDSFVVRTARLRDLMAGGLNQQGRSCYQRGLNKVGTGQGSGLVAE